MLWTQLHIVSVLINCMYVCICHYLSLSCLSQRCTIESKLHCTAEAGSKIAKNCGPACLAGRQERRKKPEGSIYSFGPLVFFVVYLIFSARLDSYRYRSTCRALVENEHQAGYLVYLPPKQSIARAIVFASTISPSLIMASISQTSSSTTSIISSSSLS